MLELAVLVISAAINISLGALVYLKNSRSASNRLFFWLTVVIIFWSSANYVSVHPVGLEKLFWVRLVMVFAALLNLFVYLTFSVFPDYKFGPKGHLTRWLAIISTVVLIILSQTPLVFSGITANGGAQPGPAIVLFLLHTVVLLGGGVTMIARKFSHAKGLTRQQLKYVMLGLILTFGLIFISNLVLVAFFKNSSLVPLGPAYTLCFSIAVAYAVVRHRLLDIRAVVARSLAFVSLLVALAFIFALVMISVSSILFPSSRPSMSQLGIYLVPSVLFALAFQRLRRFFEKLTDRVFYRDRYDSQVVINNFSQILVSELHIERILKRSLAAVCESLHIQFGQIIVFRDGRVYRIEHYGPLPQRLMVAPELRRLNRSMLIADELETGDRKALLEEHGVRVSMMLSTREEFVGYLLLGDKLSGDIYSTQDVNVLEIIGKELAVAILNARAYAEIQDFNASLQARVDHATNRLRVANRHLKELDRAKDEFISMASHQLRTPLTTIKGYLSMMLEGDVGKMSDAQKEFVGYAFSSSERMVNLISDLLNVSRLQAGRFLIQTKPTDMVQMIEDEVRQLRTHAQAKGIQLIFDHPDKPLPPVEIDDNKTRQVIMNFIDNAIYYTQAGEVRVALHQTGDHVRLEVRDTGIGVPKDARKKLFSKFFRAGNAQIVRPDGTGLGLYLAKRVVEDQGGTIIFDSVEGKGSTFGFELPFHAESNKQEVNNDRHVGSKH